MVASLVFFIFPSHWPKEKYLAIKVEGSVYCFHAAHFHFDNIFHTAFALHCAGSRAVTYF